MIWFLPLFCFLVFASLRANDSDSSLDQLYLSKCVHVLFVGAPHSLLHEIGELGVDVTAEPRELQPSPPFVVVLLADGEKRSFFPQGLGMLGTVGFSEERVLNVHLLTLFGVRQRLSFLAFFQVLEHAANLRYFLIEFDLLQLLSDNERRVAELRSTIGFQIAHLLEEATELCEEHKQFGLSREIVEDKGLHCLVVLVDRIKAVLLQALPVLAEQILVKGLVHLAEYFEVA